MLLTLQPASSNGVLYGFFYPVTNSFVILPLHYEGVHFNGSTFERISGGATLLAFYYPTDWEFVPPEVKGLAMISIAINYKETTMIVIGWTNKEINMQVLNPGLPLQDLVTPAAIALGSKVKVTET